MATALCRKSWSGRTGVQEMGAVVYQVRRREMDRDPKVHLAHTECEIPRHNANDGVLLAVDEDFPVNGSGLSGIAPLPQRVADHGHLGAGTILLLGKDR